MPSRRFFLGRTAALSATLFAAKNADATPAAPTSQVAPRGGYLGTSSGSLSKLDTHTGPVQTTPVITTDIGDLPFELDGDTKVFRLTAHVFQQQIAPNKTIDVWGFNGSAPGPTIQVTQGDKIRVLFTNNLPEPSSLHWHGFEDTLSNDGMPGISQPLVKPGESFTYNFTIHQEGTFFYHSHMAMQELAGMLGAVIMHPRVPYRPHCDKDFVLHLQEYAVLANQTTPDTMMMEFNWLLLNGKAGPASTPLLVRQGERVRIRFINLGMDHHPMHVHGHTFYTTGTEGGRIPETAWWPGNTVLVGVAQARDVEFVANNPGDWMLHCHLPHHMMNQMSSQVGPMTRPMSKASGMKNSSPMDGMPGMDMTSPPQSATLGNPSSRPERSAAEGSPSNSPAAIPPITLAAAAGTAATTGPLADSHLDPGMMGAMQEQSSGQPRMSDLQKRNLDALDMSSSSMQQQGNETSPNASNVPNYPQDAFMEGPMMNMGHLVDKPENLGLRPDWSRFMQGMMTFVRVLPPEQYDHVLRAMQQANRPADPYASLYLAPHETTTARR